MLKLTTAGASTSMARCSATIGSDFSWIWGKPSTASWNCRLSLIRNHPTHFKVRMFFPVGTDIQAVVLDTVEDNRQFRLSMRPSDLARESWERDRAVE